VPVFVVPGRFITILSVHQYIVHKYEKIKGRSEELITEKLNS
jgi:hypothetical protein